MRKTRTIKPLNADALDYVVRRRRRRCPGSDPQSRAIRSCGPVPVRRRRTARVGCCRSARVYCVGQSAAIKRIDDQSVDAVAHDLHSASRAVTITGRPAAIASRTTIPNGSTRDGRTNADALLVAQLTLPRLNLPGRTTRPSSRARLTRSSSGGRAPPHRARPELRAGQRDRDLVGGDNVRLVLLPRPVPASRPRLWPRPGRAGVPAGQPARWPSCRFACQPASSAASAEGSPSAAG